MLHFLTTVPFLIIAAFDERAFPDMVRNHKAVGDLELAVVWYGVVQAIGFIALVLGINGRAAVALARKIPIFGQNFTTHRYYLALAFSLAIGLGAFALFLSNIGGYSVLISNMARRNKLGEGNGYVLQAIAVLGLATGMAIYANRYGRSLGKLIFAAMIMGLTAFVFSSNGTRMRTVLLVLQSTLVWHYGVERIRRPGRLALIGMLVLGPFMVAMPLIRNTLSDVKNTRLVAQSDGIISDVLAQLVDPERGFFAEISYVETYVLVTSYFHLDNLWWGRTYLDLLALPIPRSIYPDKPPGDEGIYIGDIAFGNDPRPGQPADELSPLSWPPFTLGCSYMNFWLFGVAAISYAQGTIYSAAYHYIQHSGCTLFSTVAYGYAIFYFQITNLQIVQVAIWVGIAALICRAFFGGRPAPTPQPRPTLAESAA